MPPVLINQKKQRTTPFQVPENLSFLIHAKVDKMHYDKVDYQI